MRCAVDANLGKDFLQILNGKDSCHDFPVTLMDFAMGFSAVPSGFHVFRFDSLGVC